MHNFHSKLDGDLTTIPLKKSFIFKIRKTAVTEAFVRLHERDLIYRKSGLVNWSCALRSTISDIEVEHVDVPENGKLTVPGIDRPVTIGKLYFVSYPVETTCPSASTTVTVATTRPETILADVALCLHPEDTRANELAGLRVKNPLTGDILPVIFDSAVDREFGTGVLKITPGHDPIDYEIAQRHNLPSVSIFNESGAIDCDHEDFKGLNRFEARWKAVKCLREQGLLDKIDNYATTVPVCSRSGDLVEKMLKEQWFVRCDGMAKKAMEAVEEGKLEMIPKFYEKTWFHWLSNIRDWCISRQISWGHTIPAYKVTCPDGSTFWVSAHSKRTARRKAIERFGGTDDQSPLVLKQDPDVLDTWFSSALLPFSSLGWPKQSEALSTRYPLDVMETGSDILFFWVARMVMLGVELTGQVPFKKVLLHGVLRDQNGRKMSKSLGNVIDPLHVINGARIEEVFSSTTSVAKDSKKFVSSKFFSGRIPAYGADPLRMSFCSMDATSQEVNFDWDRLSKFRRLSNKLWQAARFLLLNLPGNDLSAVQRDLPPKSALDLKAKWILSRLVVLIEASTMGYSHFHFHIVARDLERFIQQELCDTYLECLKPDLQQATGSKIAALTPLYTSLHVAVRLLHPIMPFLTEEIFRTLQPNAWSVALSEWPYAAQFGHLRCVEAEERFAQVIAVSKYLLKVRALLGLTRQKLEVGLDRDVMDDSQLESLRILSRSKAVWNGVGHQDRFLPCGEVDGMNIYIERKGCEDSEKLYELSPIGKEQNFSSKKKKQFR